MTDPGLTLHVGDVRDILLTLPDGSVDCVITSPPYWGLRDYGTGTWAGGNPDCDHHDHAGDIGERNADGNSFRNSSRYVNQGDEARDVCGRCGATRQDQQLGLDASPDEYVASMVAVFREVWRVLADHGTCWINIGDSYAGSPGGSGGWDGNNKNADGTARTSRHASERWANKSHGLKPKDLCGIPWRLAFALQQAGWYLRSEIIWAKPNPMPESVTDRPTKSHEQVFLLTKQPRYWFDAEAVREPHARIWDSTNGGNLSPDGDHKANGSYRERGGSYPLPNPAGRNIRSVWSIATQPYPEAHFATYPEELVRRCLLAGCAREVCRVCWKPRERIVEASYEHVNFTAPREHSSYVASRGQVANRRNETLGWSDCGHSDYRPGIVLDPFLGSGTTALVARRHGRHAVGIELNEEYARLAVERVRWWHRKPESVEPPHPDQLVLGFA